MSGISTLTHPCAAVLGVSVTQERDPQTRRRFQKSELVDDLPELHASRVERPTHTPAGVQTKREVDRASRILCCSAARA